MSKGLCIPSLMCLTTVLILIPRSFKSFMKQAYTQVLPPCLFFLPRDPGWSSMCLLTPCSFGNFLGLVILVLVLLLPMVSVIYTGFFKFSISILPFPSRSDLRAHTHVCAATCTYTHTHETLKKILCICITRGILVQDNRLC